MGAQLSAQRRRRVPHSDQSSEVTPSRSSRESRTAVRSSKLWSHAKGGAQKEEREISEQNEEKEQGASAQPDATNGAKARRQSVTSTKSNKMVQPATVPCQYRTGKTLGSGTYAIVKEAVHIKTGKYYACKVINKKLMEGREYMVRNEIAVLKKISKGHRNIVTLHDYFETAHNLYLIFDLCTGGELFDRICAKGNYYEADAAELIRTILGAVKYLHDCEIVHRDLKPENLIFRTKAEDADVMIADFGLSRIMDDNLLTEVCGTPGYMAPEIFKKTGHGKPVDIWAMGVITYFLLCGYTPFDRETQQQEMEAILAGDYKFEPAEYWANVSETAKDFVSSCLTIDPGSRPTAEEALQHGWLASKEPHYVPDPENPDGGMTDLLPHVKKHFDARKTFRKAVFSMMAMKRMSTLAHQHGSKVGGQNLMELLEESEKEHVDEDHSVIHLDDVSMSSSESEAGSRADNGELANALAQVKLAPVPVVATD